MRRPDIWERERAPAKINLALHVRGRRADGYHALESLFVFAEDGDLLEARARDDEEIAFAAEGPFANALGTDSDNLVVRAARLLKAKGGVESGADLRLSKNLPVASGIGGGSADAAAVLRLLNRLWGLDWPVEALLPLGEELGSDVPACIMGGALRVTGRGETLEPIAGDWQGVPMLLVNPGVAVSTAQVFAAWDGVDRGALGDYLQVARNDLEPPARALAPEISEVLDRLVDMPGQKLVRMSGSGATCFALFDDDASRDGAAKIIAKARPDWWCLGTRIA